MAREVKKYTKEEIAGYVTILFSPENKCLGGLSIETVISRATLATWKKKAEKEKMYTNALKLSIRCIHPRGF